MSFNLNKNQKESVEHEKGPLLIIAGAGTGKTAVITQRIIHLVNSGLVKPSEILALTFTEKAAAEMLERVDISMPVGYDEIEISTFHSFCDSVLRQDGINVGLDSNYTLMSQAQSYILFKKNIYNFALESLRPLGNPTSNIVDILKHFSRLQDEDVSPADYLEYVEDLRKDGLIDEVEVEQSYELAKTYEQYTDLKISSSKLDFGDLIISTLNLFRSKPHILEQYRKRFKYILVDEYQDTNYTQNVLVNMLALGVNPEKATKKDRDSANITVVGDDDQAIYKFRGAAISNIMQFNETYPSTKKIVLSENYRSRQEILNGAYDVIQNNNPYRLEISEGIDKRLVSSREFEDRKDPIIQLKIRETGAEEADFVAKEILKITGNKDRLKNDNQIVESEYSSEGQSMFVDVADDAGAEFQFGDIAVLARANAHLDEFIQAFKYYGIPFKFAGPKGLYSRPEIQVLISFLKVIADYSDDISMFNLIKMPVFQLSARDIIDLMREAKSKRISIFEILETLWDVKIGENEEQNQMFGFTEREVSNHVKAMFSHESVISVTTLLNHFINAFEQVKKGDSVGEILYDFFKNSGYLDSLLKADTYDSQFMIQNISKYFDMIKDYENDNPGSRVVDYVDYLNYSLEIGENPKVDQDLFEDFDAVKIMTIHGSKGLEFPAVFIVNMVSDRFPTKNRTDRLPIPEALVKEDLPAELSSKEEHIAEERRLFYVAITRAKERLYLSAARFYGDTKRPKKNSIFVEELFQKKLVDTGEFTTGGKGMIPAFAVQVSSYDDSLDITGLGVNNVEKISYSDVDTYDKCPKQYKYRNILGLRGRGGEALSFGSLMHKTFNDIYLEISNSGQIPPLEDFIDMYSRNWVSDGFDNKQHEKLRKKRGESIIRDFYKENFEGKDELPYEIFALEKRFQYRLNDIVVKGAIDRIDILGTNEEGRPIVELIDYKTGKVKDERDVKNNLQLAIYAIVAEEVFNLEVKDATLYFVEHNEKMRADLTLELKEQARAKLVNTVEQIRAGNFNPTPGYLCRFCDYKTICEDADV